MLISKGFRISRRTTMNGYKKDYKLEEKFSEYTDMKIMFADLAEKYDKKIAFVTKEKNKENKDVKYINTSYRELFEEINALGTAILKRGFQSATTGIIGANSYKWCLSYFTSACGIGKTVPLDHLLPAEEIESCLSRAGINILFCDKAHYGVLKPLLKKEDVNVELMVGLDFKPEEGVNIDDLLEEGRDLLNKGDRIYLDRNIDPDACNFILFTSGTTQKSKAVMMSHRAFMSCNYGMNCEEVFFKGDVSLLILPLHHCYGMSGLITFLTQGIKNAFCDGLRYIVPNLKEYKVSVIMSVPLLLENMYKKIWKAIEKENAEGKIKTALRLCDASDKIGINLRGKVFSAIKKQLGGHLRFIINGAAPLNPQVAKGMNDFGILTVNGYGLTETAPTIASETYRYLRPGSVGKVMPNVTAKIENPDEAGIGELVVKGDNVMLGYMDDEEATSEVLRDGWFYTGDLAYFDEDNYLFICGRKKDVIVMKNGKNIFPDEIESLINRIPYVSESMIFTRNKANDFVIWAKIVPDKAIVHEAGLSKEDVEAEISKYMDEINSEMPSYKMVKKYFISDKPMIKTTTQKIKRREEKKQIDQELADRELL